jgi:hypothetical protein
VQKKKKRQKLNKWRRFVQWHRGEPE